MYNPTVDYGPWALYEVIEEPYVFESTVLGDFNTLKNKPNVESASQSGTTQSLVTTGEKYTWNNKQNALVSGTNIKTINSTSIVGSGNLSVGTVTGVKINNTTKTPTSGTVDLGTVITGVKLGSTTLTPSSGVVTITTTSNVTSDNNSPITSGGVYTALQSYETKLSFTTSSSTSYTASRNTYYRHTNTPSSLSITLPTSSLVAGDVCAFNFTPSSSFSGFTITGGAINKMKDFAIEASKTYEVVALYNGSRWLVTATEFE